MQLYKLTEDIKVICVEAESFPAGIKGAFCKIFQLVPDAAERGVFGISKPQNGSIRYRAAVKQSTEGEGTALGYPTFVIEKGAYLGETLMDWQANEMMIMSIFNRLVADKRLDGGAHCIEYYKSQTELLCLVLMKAGTAKPEQITELTI